MIIHGIFKWYKEYMFIIENTKKHKGENLMYS